MSSQYIRISDRYKIKGNTAPKNSKRHRTHHTQGIHFFSPDRKLRYKVQNILYHMQMFVTFYLSVQSLTKVDEQNFALPLFGDLCR